MIYSRSDTSLDRASLFTPVSFLGSADRMRLSRIGFLDTLFPSDIGGTDAGGIVSVYDTAPSGSGFDWNSMISTVGETIGQIYTVKTQAELQQMNMERAAKGLAPIPPSAVAPQVNVGIAPEVQRTLLTIGLGGAAILAGAYAFGVIGKRRRGRRR
jgi:hypothetical protein